MRSSVALAKFRETGEGVTTGLTGMIRACFFSGAQSSACVPYNFTLTEQMECMVKGYGGAEKMLTGWGREDRSGGLRRGALLRRILAMDWRDMTLAL